MSEPSEPNFTTLAPGQGIRWAFGTKDGLRSSTWRFWGNKKGDFYVAVRTLGGLFKTSLHRDGWCQTGATEEFVKKWPDKGPPRKLDRWQLPDTPITTALQIVTPAEEMDIFASEETEPMVWLPAPASGLIAVVTIVVWRMDVAFAMTERWPGESHGTQPIGLAATPSRSAIVVQGVNPLTDETREMIEGYRAQLRTNAPPDFAPGPGRRAILVGQRSGGPRFLAELSLRA